MPELKNASRLFSVLQLGWHTRTLACARTLDSTLELSKAVVFQHIFL